VLQIVEYVHVLLLEVAYYGRLVAFVNGKADDAVTRVVGDLEHVVLPGQVHRRALEVQHQLRHVRLRLRRRREAGVGTRRVTGHHGKLYLRGELVADDLVNLWRQRRDGRAGVDDRPACPVRQRERGLRHRQPRRPDGDALQREVVKSWIGRVLD
ncbi:Os03g0318150, partial [Oryza sativa Japonica Group]